MNRTPTNPEALAKAACEWLTMRVCVRAATQTEGQRIADEADLALEARLRDQDVISPSEAIESLDDAEGFAVLVTLESGEWFTIDRQGNVLTND